MAHQAIVTEWKGKMQFDALVNGHTIIMDTPERVGGEDRGPIPKPFVLVALSGCTGMDVVALLRRSGTMIERFSLETSGELSRRAPIEYVAMHVVYNFQAPAMGKEAIVQAVTDSQERLCGVSHMLKKAIPVSWEINLNQEMIFSNKRVATEPAPAK